MKTSTAFLLTLGLLAAPAAQAGDVGVNLNISLGNPAPVVIAPAPAPVIVSEPPLFLVPPALGFSVAVGVPYGMFHIDNRYYLCDNEVWYVGNRYDGPWTVVVRDRLPAKLRKHRYEKIVLIRDEEYHYYRKDRNRYHGRSYRADHHDDDRRERKHHKHKHRDRDDD